MFVYVYGTARTAGKFDIALMVWKASIRLFAGTHLTCLRHDLHVENALDF